MPLLNSLRQLMHRHRILVAVIVFLDHLKIGVDAPVFTAVGCTQFNGRFAAIAFGRFRHRHVALPAVTRKIMRYAADRIALIPEISMSVVVEIDRQVRKLLGMNWPKPIAPAQEPTGCSGS